ncbi:hypothetical protein [Flavobacterium sp.]|uniref:hypothetical protein n=1 Tax=Flavobacterium sp. TaxID=239 RepID=UPI00333E46BD
MKSLLIFLLLLQSSCSTFNRQDRNLNPCNENIEFKKQFFYHLQVVDEYMHLVNPKVLNIDELQKLVTQEKIKNFNISLNFISKYTHVSYEYISHSRYPYGVYEEDKSVWLKWYEENKCNNIQIKL